VEADTIGDEMPYAHNGSVSLCYHTFGIPERPALLMINGLGSQAINYPADFCQRFVSQGFFVIRFDNRDVGLSTKFDKFDQSRPDVMSVVRAVTNGEEPVVAYRLTDMAADAVAVLDELGIDRAHVMGVSVGGMIVQQLAIDHPGRLLSMTSAMSTTGDPDVGQSSPEALAVLLGPPATDRSSAVARAQELMRICGSPARYDSKRVGELAGQAFDRSFDPDGVARQLIAGIASGSRSEALRAVRVPALVLHGDADTLIDVSGGRRTAECIPGARIEVIEGMGHDYPPAYWDRWVELIANHAGVTVET
jgi:pimeloyl-ACP methyl ester carboxylesterase